MTKTEWNIGVEGPIVPSESLPPLPEISRGGLLIITGRAPIWRYAMAVHKAHGSPAGAIATYDPRLGAVIVATHSSAYMVGQIIE